MAGLKPVTFLVHLTGREPVPCLPVLQRTHGAPIRCSYGAVSRTSAAEFCLTETFRAECPDPDRQAILINQAVFGRMQLGRCVAMNYGHIGCSVDVIAYLDRLCSGRASCQLSISDPGLVRTRPCPPDFSAYLDVEFSCVTGR